VPKYDTDQLINQCLNDAFRDAGMFNERKKRFNEMWDSSNSISIAEKGSEKEFLDEIRNKLNETELMEVLT
jgi:hypothetical protein